MNLYQILYNNSMCIQPKYRVHFIPEIERISREKRLICEFIKNIVSKLLHINEAVVIVPT